MKKRENLLLNNILIKASHVTSRFLFNHYGIILERRTLNRRQGFRRHENRRFQDRRHNLK